jgi:hypothetical protein
MIFSFEVLPSNADLSSLRRAPDENSSMPLERCKAFVSGIFGMSEFSYLLIFRAPSNFRGPRFIDDVLVDIRNQGLAVAR